MGGADAVILASLSSVSNMKLMVHPKSGIKRITDLKGKVLGVSQYGSEADVVARIMISQGGLGPRDVNILQLGGHSQAAQALIAARSFLTGTPRALPGPRVPRLDTLRAETM